MKGQTYPGPLSFSLYAANASVKGAVSYRIVPAANYASNGFGKSGAEDMIAKLKQEKSTSFISMDKVVATVSAKTAYSPRS